MYNLNNKIEINTSTYQLLSRYRRPRLDFVTTSTYRGLRFYTTQPPSLISRQSPPSWYLFL